MRNKIFLLVALALTAFSCDNYLDINTNPNSPASATPELVLPNALSATGGSLFYNQMGAMWVGQWAPSGDVSGFVQEKTYDFNNTYGAGIWTGFYDILNDYKYIQDAGALAGRKGSPAIAKIMSVFLYHKLVDTYGNVPYSEALQGTTIIRPSYDNAQGVYEAIIDDLDEAVADLKSITDPIDNPGTADIVFGGNYTNWVKFANTLKLRLLVRQSEMPGRETYIAGEIAQIDQTIGFLTTDASLTPGYLKTAGKLNPFWTNYYKNENDALNSNFNFYRSSAFTVSTLQNDPRLYYIVAPTGANGSAATQVTTVGSRIGVQYGNESATAYSNVTSGIGFGILKSFDMPMVLITAAESFFLQAEATQHGWLATSTPEALWKSGIHASFRLLGVIPATVSVNDTGNAFATYYNDVAQPTFAANPIAAIIRQKYIASIGYGGFEAWSDYRRLGMPAVPLSIRAIKDNIPVRLYYPAQELQTNSGNVAAQGNIDALSTRIFWDVD